MIEREAKRRRSRLDTGQANRLTNGCSGLSAGVFRYRV